MVDCGTISRPQVVGRTDQGGRDEEDGVALIGRVERQIQPQGF